MKEERNNELFDFDDENDVEIAADKKIEIGDAIEKEIKFNFSQEIDRDATTETSEIPEKEQSKKKQRKAIDISKVNIIDSTALEKETDLRNALFGSKSAFQIVAAQSGYMAKIIPLVHKDIISLLFSNLGRYEHKKAIFKVIYEKIAAISSERMSFEEWLRNTSVEDIETFYYGLYNATFPNEGTYTFICPNCGEERSIRIGHNNLFRTTDKAKMKKLINTVSKEAISKAAREKYSLVGKTEAFVLDDSGIIVEIRTPSLWDSLEILRVVPEKVIDRDAISVTNMLYVKRFLIPNKSKDGYTEQKDSQELLRIIDNLTIDDANTLQDAVSDRVDENRITYSIKNIKCPNCQHEVRETPISIEDILFTVIFDKTQF